MIWIRLVKPWVPRRVFHISIGGLTHILCATKCKYENFKGKSNKGKCNTMYIEFKDVNGTGFAELMCYVDLHTEKTTDYVCFTYRKRYTFDCPSTTKPYEFKRDKLINRIKERAILHAQNVSCIVRPTD